MILLHDDVVVARILQINVYRRRVSHVTNATLLWIDLVRHSILFDDWMAHSYVQELEPELIGLVIARHTSRECVARNELIGLHNLLDLDVDEVIERVDVLLDEASQAQESWNELPFFL